MNEAPQEGFEPELTVMTGSDIASGVAGIPPRFRLRASDMAADSQERLRIPCSLNYIHAYE